MNLHDLRAYLKVDIICPDGVSPESVVIDRVSPIESAERGAITFLASAKYAEHIGKSKASAVITRTEIPNCPIPQVLHKDPHFAFAKTSSLFYKVDHGEPAISENATISPSAKIGQRVKIFPYVYVGDSAEIGDDVVLYPGVFVGANAKVGAKSVVHANCSVGERCIIGESNLIHAGCVIGADGFGFAPGEGSIAKIPQTGIVRTEEDVELGGCCTLDRATMGETLVKRGCKFDSRVHIGHNAVIGENCLFSSMTAVAGSANVGNWVATGGQAAIAGHFRVGNGVRIGAKAGVISPVEDGQTVMGFPAVPAMQWRRGIAHTKRLGDYEKRIKELEARLAKLEGSNGQ